jgi:single-strand DNA-binding protein
MIKLLLLGHLGGDSVVNNVNGRNVINFQCCHSEKYKDAQGTEVNKSVWVSCAYWTDKTNIAQYLKKGTRVYVEGQPDVKLYKNSNGENKANITCRVISIQLLGTNQKENTVTLQSNQPITEQPGYKPVPTDYSLTGEDDYNDLPF